MNCTVRLLTPNRHASHDVFCVQAMANNLPARAMTTLIDRISQREEWVVASLLDNLDKPWGPNICSALEHVEHWQNPIATKLAFAINLSMANLTKANIMTKLEFDYRVWLRHPSYLQGAGLPLDLAEHEAHDLCVYYRGKRLSRLIGDAYTKLQDHPEQAKCVAQSLISALQEFA